VDLNSKVTFHISLVASSHSTKLRKFTWTTSRIDLVNLMRRLEAFLNYKNRTKQICKQVTYTIGMANLPNFLQKPGSYMSQLLQGTWPGPGCPCFFGIPPTSYTQYKLDKSQSMMFIARVGFHTMFLGVFHDSTSCSHSSSLVEVIGEVLLTWCSGKGSKCFSFNLCLCCRIAFFISSMQPFLTTESSVSI
jgi:hypothetical protein